MNAFVRVDLSVKRSCTWLQKNFDLETLPEVIYRNKFAVFGLLLVMSCKQLVTWNSRPLYIFHKHLKVISFDCGVIVLLGLSLKSH